MMNENILFAFLLTLLAGLSTGIGGIIAFMKKDMNAKFLSFTLGLSAGVMLYVSFVEILVESQEVLANIYGSKLGNLYAILSFFGGILLIGLIDTLVPSTFNPHDMHSFSEKEKEDLQKKSFMRIGIFTAIAITIHNFPEGLATFVSAVEDPSLGITIAFAIAIHNIPEGIAVSVPVYYATGSKRKALRYSFLSGLSEPLGAIAGYFLLMHFFSDNIMGFIFGIVAGIMVFISLDELLPAAQKFGKHHWSIYGVVAGMAIMAVSLILLG
jgi:ZIP family zinc transporter